ncbi:MAG: hypothetical protein Q9222_001946 [Ikaeria aurantiellina]
MLLTDEPASANNKLLTTFDAALRGLGKRILLGRLRILFLWDKSYGPLACQVHSVIDQYIDKAMERKAKQKKMSPSTLVDFQRSVILDELLDVLSSREEIRNQIINIFLPGRDATAIGLSGVLFHLARHPRVWQKLRKQVLSMKSPLSYETLKSLGYMRQVLNESFRLLMLANRNIRVCLQACILPTGGGFQGKSPIFIPRGAQIVLNHGATHRDKTIWGEDADDFCPERREKMKLGWHYIPFSGGPRICPGQQLALTECAYVLARLVQEFDSVENRDPEMDFVEESRLTVESRNGVKVAFHQDPCVD